MEKIWLLVLLITFSCAAFKYSEHSIEKTKWKIKSIEYNSVKYEFAKEVENSINIEFSKLKKKKFGMMGEFVITSTAKEKESLNYISTPYRGFYVLGKRSNDFIKMGWINHKSYNPDFNKTELGNLIHECFVIKSGSYSISDTTLVISSENLKIEMITVGYPASPSEK